MRGLSTSLSCVAPSTKRQSASVVRDAPSTRIAEAKERRNLTPLTVNEPLICWTVWLLKYGRVCNWFDQLPSSVTPSIKLSPVRLSMAPLVPAQLGTASRREQCVSPPTSPSSPYHQQQKQ